MTPSTDLHELIHSLTKTEKRYFKLYVARTSGTKNTLALKVFDAIAKQKSYDEEALLKNFDEKSLTLNFSSYKNHVYNAILRALSNYREATSVADSLSSQIRQVKILLEKSLFKQAYKLNRRISKQALANEDFASVMESIAIDRQILFARSGEYLFDAEPDVIVKRLNTMTDRALRQWQKTSEMKNIELTLVEANHNFSKRFATLKEGELWAENLLHHPHFLADAEPETLNQFVCYHYVHFLYQARYCGNLREGLRHVLLIAEKYEAQPERIKNHGVMYLTVCTWVITSAIWMYNDTVATEYIEKMRTALGRYRIEHSMAADKYVLQSYMYESALLLMTLDDRRILKFAEQAEKALEEWKHLKYYQEEQQIISTLATLLFAIGCYNESIAWCTRFLNNKLSYNDPMISIIVRSCLLLSHFQLGNFEILSSLSRSSLRIARQAMLDRPHVKAFFLSMQRIACAESDKEIHRHIQVMLDGVQSIRNKQSQTLQAQPDQSVFVVWGNAQRKGISYKEEALLRIRMAQVENVAN